MKTIRSAAKLLRILRQEGVLRFAERLRHSLVLRTYCVYGMALENTALIPPATEAVIRVGAIEELRAWRKSRAALPTPFVGDQTEGWQHFCWAWMGSEPVAIVWVTFSSPLLHLQHEEAALVDAYTVPTFRGRGIGAALIAAACLHMHHLGARAGYATVESDNRPSRRAFEAAGFRMLGIFTWRGLLSRRPAARQFICRLSTARGGAKG